MNVAVSLDMTNVTRRHRALWADQLPYATSLAINETAKKAQRVQGFHMMKVFTVRRPAFVGKAAKIKPFATKRALSATILIEPPGGKVRADILSKFEDGGTKRPRGQRLAIPIEARRGKAGIVSQANRPSAFNFKLKGAGPKGQVYEGDKRTFMIKRPGGKGLIVQRVGKGAARSSIKTGRQLAGTRVLFAFRPSVKIDNRLHLEKNTKSTVRAAWASEFGKAFAKATATAR